MAEFLHVTSNLALLLAMWQLSAVLCSLFLLCHLLLPVNGLTASLEKDVELQAQSDCVKHCILGGWPGHLPLYNNIGCGSGRAHSCVCHEDRRAQANRFFSKCLTNDLTALACMTQDHASALSIFDRYCGFESTAASAAAATARATTTTPTQATTPSTAQVGATLSGEGAARTSTPTAASSPVRTPPSGARASASSSSAALSSSTALTGELP
jgi:hypothetical protein